ncbi:hypothetical protein Salat_0178600 [Sesamum alatum]|uniref:Uncharacterized protein n=1 Tax=Sesamum alatum TaxID=300844 RepID=A0AAE1YYT3_9LAMI|nr:hypothetical protein Salat_0178600 [Sesamum alatum]
MESMTLTRSLLCTGLVLTTLPFYQSFKFLRDSQKLLNREYFPYLQSYCEVDTPSEVFQMAQLRHIQMTEIFLPNPIDKENPVFLRDLETLSTIANFRCTEEVLRKFPNLKKLGVYYYAAGIEDWSAYGLKNLVRLSKLENLKCVFNWPPNETLLPNLSFPQSLKKLTLNGSKLSWKDMSIIGSLPHLEVLKLEQYAFTGAVWEPIEGEFSQLRFLLIKRTQLVRWIAENTHFPCLEHLIIRECRDLEAIPSGIGDIATLKMIDIDDCSSSAVASVEQILEEQRDMENNVLQVLVRRNLFTSPAGNRSSTFPSSLPSTYDLLLQPTRLDAGILPTPCGVCVFTHTVVLRRRSATTKLTMPSHYPLPGDLVPPPRFHFAPPTPPSVRVEKPSSSPDLMPATASLTCSTC